ncbi:putative peptidyl-tRNA hydrolase PTRHD1 isoform X2 [Brachypodium distachyon]|uniref:putative peptidyl-tRNA hydrolase PTRHD1 isoform X2 n=1 Tax=Brachypodium distachyon TaxID=15368 RepID=UPI0001D440AF|nr:putative peptidyl-tRNA hydrolase PTRHD1 isoform X2 [Brachypodium distachyon]|eukprot:XP_024311671.1 putative peptidyl-tRNA hydrolase PTRHD1 isoform X2 [Brachypodium distachyon]
MLSLLPLRLPSPAATTLPSAALLLLLPGVTRVRTLRTPPRANMSAAAASTTDAAASSAGVEAGKEAEDVVVQYVVLRRDLVEAWPLGSVVAQGCHAAVAALWVHRDHPDTAAYCAPENLDRMHKVTLEVKGETQLKNLAEKLEAAGVRHKLWIEQPENTPTCIATAPCPKSQL